MPDGNGKDGVAGPTFRERQDEAVDAFFAERGAGPAQLPLLPALTTAEFADGPAPAGEAKRGPGRPPGQMNRRNAEFIEYLEGLGYRSPLHGAAEMWSRPVAALAKELGCTPKEAMAFQLQAMNMAMPYWHQKLPQAIQFEPGGDMTVAMLDPRQLLTMLLAQIAADPEDKIAGTGVQILNALIEHQPAAAGDAQPEETNGDDRS